VITCPSCGTENPHGARFCLQCGTALEASPVREERKVVSIVFCDLVGSTARAEHLDPEDVRALLSSYHGRVRAELERHGGTVEKFIGDAVVAVFGAPVVHEDDAERAVRAALAIRDWARDDGEVEVRIAVNTGEALVSVGSRPDAGEGMVAGDVVNTAARLQGAAPVNGVLVGESTHRATERAIVYREHDAVDAKGKAQPVAVWEAVDARARLGVDVDLGPLTRLVGRLRELDQLRGALGRAREERQPQLVTIVGVPGMGKSRLVQELSSLVENEPELTRWRQGRSLPYGEGVSFWALGEMVKAEAGILESDPGDVTHAKLLEVVERVSTPADAPRLASLLGPLVGLAEDAAAGDRRTESFAAWRRFLENLADERATVLVFEDLHWADDGLLDFVDALVERATDVPLLVVATARPELLARRPGWGGGKPNAVTLSLSPLSDVETAELVHAILERAVLPADMQAAVLARAGGNPLYAEEFARMVAERGAQGGDELPLPESLQGLIAARLDGLAAAEKELLQDAAVVGKVFWPGALGGEPGATEEALYALERREFIRRERRSSVGDEMQYAFRHVLVRDVAYGQIPRATRAAKHERVAAWIQANVRGEDAAEQLAHHYLSALEYARAAGRDDPELRARAREALRDAGRRASALNAFGNATRFLEAAVQLTPEDDPERGRLALEHAQAGVYVDVQSSDRYLIAARARLLAGDVHDAAQAELTLGEYRWLRGETADSDEYMRSAERLSERMTDRAAKMRVLAELARFAALADEYERAAALADEALPIAEALGDDVMCAHVLNSRGISRLGVASKEGLADLERSRELARPNGGPEYLRACGNLASMLAAEGELARAYELHVEALAVAREIGYEEPTRWLRTEIAFDFSYAGEWDEAIRVVDELIPEFERSPFWIEPQTRVCRARIVFARGAIEEARAETARSVERARIGRLFQSVNDPMGFAARMHAELGELDAAGAIFDELLDIWAETQGATVAEAVPELWYAAWCTGREERLRPFVESGLTLPWITAAAALLRRDFTEAARILDGIGARPSAALARLWGAEWLRGEGRLAEADVLLEASLAFWRSVGATRYVRQGELLLAAAS
jgi:class 3 adenylate cyclase/tetratricopeptide (TPR) repeat protein